MRGNTFPGNGRRGAVVLITGGAGFIGTNVADRLLTMGHRVVMLDNLSREGVDRNALWLQRRHGGNVRIIVGDVRDQRDVRRALDGVDHVFHFAAQVAVTSSLLDPRSDFEVNALGTLNVLEEMRRLNEPPSILFTSTNKVYGGLENVRLRTEGRRYVPEDESLAAGGVSELQPLDFRSPYGCSKGCADQYVLDYGRTMGLQALVFRMSCVYGPHQLGTEDQGWVAHFLVRAMEGRELTIFGDGRQVRDVLFIDDLVDACLLACSRIDALSGSAFNIGGGPGNSVSLLEAIDEIAELNGARPVLSFQPSRSGDQRYYVSDISSFRSATGWQPKIGPRAGFRRLAEWLTAAKRLAPEEIAAS